MDAWLDGTKSSGEIRKSLDKRIWQRYDSGLWGESWSSYFGSFCKAVQPYAHYSPFLQNWQMTLISDTVTRNDDSNYIMMATVGLGTYEASKATRITLLHCVLSWTLGRVLAENVDVIELKEPLDSLRQALASSVELGMGKVDWPVQFWGCEFAKPKDIP
jgi:hypothetical protein